MRLCLFSVVCVVLISASDAGKKKRVPVPQTDLDALRSRSTAVVSDILSTHTLLQTGFKTFCEYFETFPRNLSADEVTLFTFITQYLCNMRPVLEGHGLFLERALVTLSDDRGNSVSEKLDDLRGALQAIFETVVEVQESVNKIFEAFPALTKGLSEINRKSSIFGVKIKQLKQLITSQRAQWPPMTEALHVVLTDVQFNAPSAPIESAIAGVAQEIPTTTTTESSTATVEVTTAEPSLPTTEPSIDSTALALAADEALRAAVEVRNSMGKFLMAYGSMRKAVGKNPELNQRLDDMLAFPSVRALAWEKFISEFAGFARDLNDETK